MDSWHEMGTMDLPAVIDYVLQTTGESKLYYIGHSMGTSAGLVLLSVKPEYNQRLHSLIGLAPVAFFSKMTNFVGPDGMVEELAAKLMVTFYFLAFIAYSFCVWMWGWGVSNYSQFPSSNGTCKLVFMVRLSNTRVATQIIRLPLATVTKLINTVMVINITIILRQSLLVTIKKTNQWNDDIAQKGKKRRRK